jgi:hypothetical protein
MASKLVLASAAMLGLSCCAHAFSGHAMMLPTARRLSAAGSLGALDRGSSRRMGGPRAAASQARLGLRMQEMGSKPEEPSALRKFGLLGVWAAFGAFVISTGGSGNAEEQKLLLQGLLSFPPSGPISPIFVSIFALLGVWPVVMAALLAPLR